MGEKSRKPLGDRYQELLAKNLDSVPRGEHQKIMQEVQRIGDIFVSRNLKGKEYEKAGNIDKAKELYEANVLDRFHGSHPYERLRIIYVREARYADAIRVCEAYMETFDSQEEKAEYEKKVEKLKKKAKS
jgi:tetratricopeptide (TPR) repeat protein